MVHSYEIAELNVNECVGCGRVVAQARWQQHSQSCEALERFVALAMALELSQGAGAEGLEYDEA